MIKLNGFGLVDSTALLEVSRPRPADSIEFKVGLIAVFPNQFIMIT